MLSHCRFAASLGIELTMESGLTMHLSHRFDLELAESSAYASLFGLMNIFSRGAGGILSDRLHRSFSLRGRLWIHMVLMLLEGILILCFVRSTSFNSTLAAMVLFAIFGQVGQFRKIVGRRFFLNTSNSSMKHFSLSSSRIDVYGHLFWYCSLCR